MNGLERFITARDATIFTLRANKKISWMHSSRLYPLFRLEGKNLNKIYLYKRKSALLFTESNDKCTLINIIYNNSGILEFYCHSRHSKSNLQRRRRVSIVLLHRVLHQPSTYEHACQLRILHFRWIVARRQYRFQSHAYVLVQGRNHSLGHFAGSYHVRGPGYKLGRGDRYVTFRRALRNGFKKRKKIDRRIRRIIRRATKNILTTVDTTSLICFIPSALPKK